LKTKYIKGIILIGLLAVLAVVLVLKTPVLRSVLAGGKPAGTQEQVATALPKQQPMTDIFQPIRQQYDQSVHAQALKVLNDERSQPNNHVTADCYSCHSYEYQIAPANNKPALDSLKTAITCGTCHVVDESGYYVLRNKNVTESCAVCHVATSIKPGAAVHNTQSNMYKGTGALGVPEMPEKRYQEGISCADCHMPNQNHTFVATLPSQALKNKTIASCYLCHATEDEQKFAQRIDVMQEELKKKAESYDARLKALTEKMKGSPGLAANQEFKTAVDTVTTNLSFIENDKSWGIHNLNYTNAIMDDIGKKLTLAEKLSS
jgi:hypothetical protein